MLLGLDTGGTYTDAVLVDADRLEHGPAAVVASAKRLTTPGDLARGLGAAMQAVLAEAGASPAEIGLVSLSTTLATNALVEGQGGRAGLVAIGFEAADLARQGLDRALDDAPLIRIAGGHDASGAQAAPLDLAALEAGLAETLAGTPAEAYAVCGLFAVRNPAHELAAAERIRALTGRPVTCSHLLSARVGGPRRALTALLNARLTPMIDRLIRATEARAAALGIAAPMMVVRGDGALVSAGFARERPIETILSGPAASLVGAGWLTGLADALVSDIGGTTTDIAVLRGGRPRLDPDGASVGGHRTMVEAVAMATHGLGGDSRVSLVEAADGPGIVLGPRRALPVSLLATEHPALVHEALARQAAAPRADALHGVFLLAPVPAAGLAGAEAAVMARLAERPEAADKLTADRKLGQAARRLEARGLIRRAALTPSDAAHVLGLQSGWDAAAARAAAALFARQRRTDGNALADGPEALARMIVARLTRRSAELVLETALQEDGLPPGLAVSPLAAAALERHRGLAAPALPLTVPLIGLGASAPTYYPAVAEMLGAENAVPPHAGVANAVGAVVGGVRLSLTAVVTAPGEGRFRAHLPDGPEDFPDAGAAEAALTGALTDRLRAQALAAGADAPEFAHRIARREATIEGKRQYVEGEITVTATGRPRLAETAPEGTRR
ncbi:hydantoinase/oxoprolinase family protein [Paralimibaculum aggregatum]|nr:hydantoinase/oxoprolinase family protein [Limibaculum sp. NKW23]